MIEKEKVEARRLLRASSAFKEFHEAIKTLSETPAAKKVQEIRRKIENSGDAEQIIEALCEQDEAIERYERSSLYLKAEHALHKLLGSDEFQAAKACGAWLSLPETRVRTLYICDPPEGPQ